MGEAKTNGDAKNRLSDSLKDTFKHLEAQLFLWKHENWLDCAVLSVLACYDQTGKIKYTFKNFYSNIIHNTGFSLLSY